MFAIVENNEVKQVGEPSVLFPNTSGANAQFALEQGALKVFDAPREDERYYWVAFTGFQIQSDKVIREYSAIPKELDGLKKNAIASINAQAYSLLSPTDYMSIKALETGTAMPEAWKTWRESIRTSAVNAKTAINASTDIPSLITASQVTWAHDPDYVAPVEPTPGA